MYSSKGVYGFRLPKASAPFKPGNGIFVIRFNAMAMQETLSLEPVLMAFVLSSWALHTAIYVLPVLLDLSNLLVRHIHPI